MCSPTEELRQVISPINWKTFWTPPFYYIRCFEAQNDCRQRTKTRIQYTGKGKAVPLQGWTDPEVSRKLRFSDFVTMARDGGRLSALRTGRLYPQEILLVLISVRG